MCSHLFGFTPAMNVDDTPAPPTTRIKYLPPYACSLITIAIALAPLTHPWPDFVCEFVLLQLKKGGVAKAKGEGEKENECTTECKSRRRRDEKAPWALNYGSGEGGGVEKGRRRGDEKRAMYV